MNSLVLKDNEGIPRIVLDAGGEDGVASIILYSADGKRSASILSQPDGSMEIGLRGAQGLASVSMKMDSSNMGHVIITNPTGMPDAVVGSSEFSTNEPCIILFHDGQPVEYVRKKKPVNEKKKK